MPQPVICSWCNRVMRIGNPALPTSHGACPECIIALLADTVVPISDVEREIEEAERAR